MSQFSFQYRISAKDDTSKTIDGALGNLRRFGKLAARPILIPIKIASTGFNAAKGALGVLRDINLGLAPVLRGFSNLLDSGLQLGVQQKSFQSLVGRTSSTALDMAKSLVAASNGTLTLSRAMQIANRGMASGLGFEQVGTVLDFISRKAVSTGKDAAQAVDTVITGLARGSTLFLDDFGILVDGMEGIKRTFDAINGIGAFDALGPAAQKAETVRQALAEMRQQMGKIGVSGKEAFFVFQGIKNSLTSSVERLVAAIAGSDALRGALVKVQNVVEGIIQHFDTGGGLGELLFGKGKSGGLLGLAGSLLLDIGNLIGQGIIGAVLKGIAKLVHVLPQLLDVVRTWWNGPRNSPSPSTKDVVKDVYDYYTDPDATREIYRHTFTPENMDAAKRGPGLFSTLKSYFTDPDPLKIRDGKPPIKLKDALRDVFDFYRHGEFDPLFRGKEQPSAGNGGTASTAGPAGIGAMSIQTMAAGVLFATSMGKSADGVDAALEKLSMAIDKIADGFLNRATAFSFSADAFAKFKADFPDGKIAKAGQKPPTVLPANIGEPAKPLTLEERRQKRAEVAQLDREIRGAGAGIGREARQRGAARIAALREQGVKVTPWERQYIHDVERDTLKRERTEELLRRRARLVNTIEQDRSRRSKDGGPVIGQLRQRSDHITQSEVKLLKATEQQLQKMQEQKEILQQVAANGLLMAGMLGEAAKHAGAAARRLAVARR